MRVTFLLPNSGHVPVGGFKIVYEYANGLARIGHDVHVVHAPNVLKDASPIQRFKRQIRYIQRRFDGSYRPHTWSRLDPSIRLHWVPSLNAANIPRSDAIVATAWQTAEYVAGYGSDKGRKLYLIQSVETWSGPEERVMNTWRQPFRKIVIADWLKQAALSVGEEAVYIPNGLDFEAFGVDVSPESRNPQQIMMLYHPLKLKGSEDGLEALKKIKSVLPQLSATLFGVSPPPSDMPQWITYVQNPPQRELRRLYNSAAIFLSPSHLEGWPLPPAEAMMCGAALAATDIGGHREYAFDGRTALLSPAGKPDDLAANALRLIADSELRIRLSWNAFEYVKQFTWERAIRSFESVLSSEFTEGNEY